MKQKKYLSGILIAASLSSFPVVAEEVIDRIEEETARVTTSPWRENEETDPEQEADIESKPSLRDADASYFPYSSHDETSSGLSERVIKIDTPKNDDTFLYEMSEIDNKAVNPTIQPTNNKEIFNSQPSGNITVYDPKLAAYLKKKKKPFENQASIIEVTKSLIETHMMLQNNDSLATSKSVEDNLKRLTLHLN